MTFGLATCFAELLAGAASKGTVLTVTGTGTLSLPRFAVRSRAFFVKVNVTVTSNGKKTTLPARYDLLLLGKERLNVVLIFGGVNATVSPAFETKLAQKVAARLP